LHDEYLCDLGSSKATVRQQRPHVAQVRALSVPVPGQGEGGREADAVSRGHEDGRERVAAGDRAQVQPDPTIRQAAMKLAEPVAPMAP
jgi:hypothetical protein